MLTLCTAAAAGAVGCLWLKQQMQRKAPAPTDFDAFLLAPVPASQQQQNSSAATAKRKSSKTAITDFESFLKVQPATPAAAEPCATDFLSFLKDGGNSISSNNAAAAAGGSAQEAAAAGEVVPEGAVPVLVLYGTEYGFAREIAEKLSSQLKESGRFW
jgi:sulfite reductase (NADPH) flavoprotein alpha-component